MVISMLMSIFLCILGLYSVHASMIGTQPELCGPETEVTLGLNSESSTVIMLRASEDTTGVCNLRIFAPNGHVVYIRIVDQPYRESFVKFSLKWPPCTLHVFQNDNEEKSVWTGDICSNEQISDVDLLQSPITLKWTPPTNPAQILGRAILITAVGQGDICDKENYHTCMSIGHNPLFCVSNYLVCDSHMNCPKGATKSDENEKICKYPYLFTVDWLKKVKNPAELILSTKFLNSLLPKATDATKDHHWKTWKNISKHEITTTEHPSEEKDVSAIESFSIALSHYGPWGYIMLGILICGTVMMFCGVWECMRKPKPNTDAAQSSSTTVLIINNQQEETQPPRYDDLDPPSYTTLFPNIKPDNTVISAETQVSNINCDNQNQSVATTEQRSEDDTNGSNRTVAVVT